MSPEQEFRLFIALSVPEAVKDALQDAQAALRRAVPEKAPRWTRRGQFHLTLRFLGNVAAGRVEELTAELRHVAGRFATLHLKAARIGFFPDPRRPRIVWAGIGDSENRLAALWCAVQSATQPFTQEAAEHEFSGHITLARINRLQSGQAKELAKSATRFENAVFGEWTAGQIDLVRSELLPEGARHTLLAALPLSGRPAS